MIFDKDFISEDSPEETDPRIIRINKAWNKRAARWRSEIKELREEVFELKKLLSQEPKPNNQMSDFPSFFMDGNMGGFPRE